MKSKPAKEKMSRNNENKLVPKRRLREFTNEREWKEKQLGAVGTFKNGANFLLETGAGTIGKGRKLSQKAVLFRSLPGIAAPYRPEGVAQAEQLLEDVHEVLAFPGFVLQMPTHDFDHVVEEGFVGVGGVDGKEFEQGQELVLGMALQEVVELPTVGSGKGGAFVGGGRRGLHGGYEVMVVTH